MTKEPVIWICLVGGPANRQIRAWTADIKRMESLRAEGLDMQPLYAAQSDATATITKYDYDLGRLVYPGATLPSPCPHGWTGKCPHCMEGEINRLRAELPQSPRSAIIEECALVAEAQKQAFLSREYAFNQPIGSFCERFACDEVAKAIRALSDTRPDRKCK